MYSIAVNGKTKFTQMQEAECDFIAVFECFRDRETGSLFQIQEGGNK